ncbi:MAG: hypothetical protein HC803_03965 [Saprospiraceae bacterium]|nr:hypothetical protein [Saprospiraceae bacterium]
MNNPIMMVDPDGRASRHCDSCIDGDGGDVGDDNHDKEPPSFTQKYRIPVMKGKETIAQAYLNVPFVLNQETGIYEINTDGITINNFTSKGTVESIELGDVKVLKNGENRSLEVEIIAKEFEIEKTEIAKSDGNANGKVKIGKEQEQKESLVKVEIDGGGGQEESVTEITKMQSVSSSTFKISYKTSKLHMMDGNELVPFHMSQ